VSFKPEGVKRDVWQRLLNRVVEISGRERVKHDVCLIGSHARGDASPISDIDLVMFSEGESNLKETELFYLDSVSVTMFPVDVSGLLMAESVDFFKANNVFEAKLIYGCGEVLGRARDGLWGKSVDLDATKRVVGETLSNRLMAALGDATLDYGEGLRDMRVCLKEAELYAKLLIERVDPWLIIPYVYKPEGDLEALLDELYYSKSYEALGWKIKNLDLEGLMERVFRQHLEVMIQVVEKLVGYFGFAGEYVKNYVVLYLLVEEKIRSKVWSMLSERWSLEEELTMVNHDASHIMCRDKEVMWMVSLGEGEKFKLIRYGVTEY